MRLNIIIDIVFGILWTAFGFLIIPNDDMKIYGLTIWTFIYVVFVIAKEIDIE